MCYLFFVGNRKVCAVYRQRQGAREPARVGAELARIGGRRGLRQLFADEVRRSERRRLHLAKDLDKDDDAQEQAHAAPPIAGHFDLR